MHVIHMHFSHSLRAPIFRFIWFLSLIFLLPLPASGQRLHDHLQAYQVKIDSVFAESRALETVAYFQQFWRDNGNADFNACMDYIAEQLRRAGFAREPSPFQVHTADTIIAGSKSWQPHAASLRMIVPMDTLLYTLTRTRMALCVGSHSTPDTGVTAELVFIDTLKQIGKDGLAGKIAYTHRSPFSVYQKAVVQGGAVGIVSSSIPEFNRPDQNPDVVSMSGLPRRGERPAFGFKISRRWQQTIDSLLARGPVILHARVRTEFLPKRVREVTASIIGAEKPDEIIALIAHVDEPGANDNASGSAALLEMARSLRRLIAAGELPRPARTLRFMWVEEIASVRRWKASRPDEFHKVKVAFVLDMVGEDTNKTGGRFLIEKMPDPSAIWTRPPDAHTEWGQGFMPKSWMKGSYLNDLLFAACETVARREPWDFATNPFEGGSDHVPFLAEGIPAILAWHFTDRFYHTSGDNLDKVSPAEMRRVAMAVASAALYLANATPERVSALLDWLQQRAAWRMNNEIGHSRKAILQASDPAKAFEQQKTILQAWFDWYRQAFGSVAGLPIHGTNAALQAQINRMQHRLEQDFHSWIQGLHHDSQKASTH